MALHIHAGQVGWNPQEVVEVVVSGKGEIGIAAAKINQVEGGLLPRLNIQGFINQLKELVDLARKNNFLIVNDNPYSLILNDAPMSILSIEGADEVALELNSLSKSHNMAGWRLGWVAGKKEFIDAVLKVKSNMDSGMFLGLQHAAAEALKNGEEWFTSLNKVYQQRKDAAMEILDILGCSVREKQSGLFVWAKAPQSVTDVEKWIDEILYGTKVFITPGFIFGEAGRRYIRISLCCTVVLLQSLMKRKKC